MSAAAEETARDDQSGQALAETWSLEYLKASAVSVDPRALSLLERGDCKSLQAIPLAAGAGGAVVAVCSPSEERFAKIRELTGEQTRFTLISEGTLDALLSSRMFADTSATRRASAEAPARAEAPAEVETSAQEEVVAPPAEVDPAAGPAEAASRERREGDEAEQPAPAHEMAEVVDETSAPAEAPPPAPAQAPASDPSVDTIVGAVLNALKHRVGFSPDLPAVEPSGNAAPVPSTTAELLAHLDSTVETWTALRAALATIHSEFEETKRGLREVKEQLSVAHADNDQYRKRVRTLEGELAESRELVSQARTRLHEAADLLEADPTQLQESTELL
jgi:MshEN domain